MVHLRLLFIPLTRFKEDLSTIPQFVTKQTSLLLEAFLSNELLGKADGFVAEHTQALIAFAAGLIGVWPMQSVKKN